MASSSPDFNRRRQDPFRVLRLLALSPRQYVRPWYVAYFLLGAVTAGMIPILLPLMMQDIAHRLSTVAYVMGAYDLGLLTSPIWAVLAEKFQSYERLFFVSFVLVGLGTGAMPWLKNIFGWLPIALVIGSGSSGAATLASLLIVNFSPRTEWEPRIGMLQGFNGAGQVIGLFLAGIFSKGNFALGLSIASLLMVPALLFGGWGLPINGRSRTRERKPLERWRLDVRALAIFPRLNFPSGITYHLQNLNRRGLQQARSALGTPFGQFIFSWFLLGLGVSGFFTYFPLMLSSAYKLGPHWVSLTYAATAGAGIVLYILAGRWAVRVGSGQIYRWALMLRFIGFLCLLLGLIFNGGVQLFSGSIGFVLVVLAWPLLSVSGTELAARLSPFSQGAAIGIFNAAFALATVIGTFSSGPIVRYIGYQAINEIALAAIALSILFGKGFKSSELQVTAAE